MNNITPAIVAVSSFSKPQGKAYQGMIDYMDRDEAVRVDNLSKFNIFSNMLEYIDNDVKTILEQQEEIQEMSNIFTREKNKLTLKEKKQMKDTFDKAQEKASLMWQTIISFDNKYLEENNIYDSKTSKFDEERLIIAARSSIEVMLKKEKLSHAVWAANVHYNTDNIHIHISTVEPVPMRQKGYFAQWEVEKGRYLLKENAKTGELEKVPVLDKNGNQVFLEEYKGKFKLSSIEALKSKFISEIENNKELLIEIDNIKKNILEKKKDTSLFKNINLQDKMKNLYKELKAKDISRNNWQYNKNEIAHLRPLIDDISRDFIVLDEKDEYIKLEELLEKQQLKMQRQYGGNNNYKENKLNDLNARLGNAILRELREYDKALSEANYINFLNRETKAKVDKFSDKLAEKRLLSNAFYNLKSSIKKEKQNYLNEIEYSKLEYELGTDLDI